MWLYFWTVQRPKNKQKESWIESWNGERTEGHLVLYYHLVCANTEPWDHMGGHMIRIRTLYSFWGFAGGSDDKESACNTGDMGLMPGLGRSPREGNGNHSSILSWRIPWTEEPGRLQSVGSQRVDTTDWLTHMHTHTLLIFRLSSEYFPLCHQNILPTKLDHSNMAICKM